MADHADHATIAEEMSDATQVTHQPPADADATPSDESAAGAAAAHRQPPQQPSQPAITAANRIPDASSGRGRKLSVLLNRYQGDADAAGSVISRGSSSGGSCSTCSGSSGSGSGTSSCSDSQCSRCACRSISPPRRPLRPNSAPPVNARRALMRPAGPLVERPLPPPASRVQHETAHSTNSRSSPTRRASANAKMGPRAKSAVVMAMEAVTRSPRTRLPSSSSRPTPTRQLAAVTSLNETNLSATPKARRKMAKPAEPLLPLPGRLAVQRIAHSSPVPTQSHMDDGGRVQVDETVMMVEDDSKVEHEWMTSWIENALDQPMETSEQAAMPWHQQQQQQPQQWKQPQLTQHPYPLHQALMQATPAAYHQVPSAALFAAAQPPPSMFSTAASMLVSGPPVPVRDLTGFYPLDARPPINNARYPPPQPHHFLATSARPARSTASAIRPATSSQQLQPPQQQSQPLRVMALHDDGGVVIHLDDSDDED